MVVEPVPLLQRANVWIGGAIWGLDLFVFMSPWAHGQLLPLNILVVSTVLCGGYTAGFTGYQFLHRCLVGPGTTGCYVNRKVG